jgi:hypothetical protein
MNEEFQLIQASYTRIPKTTLYRGNVSQGLHIETEAEDGVRTLMPLDTQTTFKFDDAPMETIITLIHDALQGESNAIVLMTQTGKDGEYLQRKVLANRLSDDLRDLIRDNLDQALKKFAPIERTVHIRKEVPCQSEEIKS